VSGEGERQTGENYWLVNTSAWRQGMLLLMKVMCGMTGMLLLMKVMCGMTGMLLTQI
jgi:hypothetical protein